MPNRTLNDRVDSLHVRVSRLDDMPPQTEKSLSPQAPR
jgi:hypothetical protein